MKMKIVNVRVCNSYIFVSYERKDGWKVKKKYYVAPKRVFEFMRSHGCVVCKNGDYLYSSNFAK